MFKVKSKKREEPVAILGADGVCVFFRTGSGKVYSVSLSGTLCHVSSSTSEWEALLRDTQRTPIYAGDELTLTFK